MLDNYKTIYNRNFDGNTACFVNILKNKIYKFKKIFSVLAKLD